MSNHNAQAGAISFAHLAGITTPVRAPRAASPDDQEDPKSKKADDDTDPDDEVMESDEQDDDDSDDARADSEDPDEDDTEKDDKAKKASKSGVARGVAQERARWTAVVSSKSFARNPAIAAHLLANTPMTSSAILSALRDAPSATSQDAARAARNPNLGVSGPPVTATTTDRWSAAFKRAGVVK